MKVLLDVGISPRLRLPLQEALDDAPVESAIFNQWRTLRDDELLAQASLSGFTVLVTTDEKLGAEQKHTRYAASEYREAVAAEIVVPGPMGTHYGRGVALRHRRGMRGRLKRTPSKSEISDTSEGVRGR